MGVDGQNGQNGLARADRDGLPGSGPVDIPPPPARKVPPPPPKPRSPRAVARDTVTYVQAAKKIGCTPEWLRTLAKRGTIRVLGKQQGHGGPPATVISLEEAREAVKRLADSKHGRPLKRKKPPPPPGKRKPTDLVPQAQAARHVGRSETWIYTNIRNGRIRQWGRAPNPHGGSKLSLVSLKDVTTLSEASVRAPNKSHPKKRNPTAEQIAAEAARVHRSHKAKGLSTFIREEIRDFAQHIMQDSLDASSITIRANGQGGFDVVTIPRAPATNTFTV